MNMPIRTAAQDAARSPWGAVLKVKRIAEGISYVDAMRGGGLWLTPERLAQVPLAWRLARFGPQATENCPWFSETSDWFMVVLTHPDAFTAEAIAEAAHRLPTYLPQRMTARALHA